MRFPNPFNLIRRAALLTTLALCVTNVAWATNVTCPLSAIGFAATEFDNPSLQLLQRIWDSTMSAGNSEITTSTLFRILVNESTRTNYVRELGPLFSELSLSSLRLEQLIEAARLDLPADPKARSGISQIEFSKGFTDVMIAAKAARNGQPVNLRSIVEALAEHPDAAGQAMAKGLRRQAKVSTDSGLSNGKSTLDEFTTDITQKARDGRLGRTIGRARETLDVQTILGLDKKNWAVLLGEPGVGKTQVVEGLAQKIVDGQAGEFNGKRLLELNLNKFKGGTGTRGQLEERMSNLIAELEAAGDVILFIDEVHMMMGSSNEAAELANALKPAIARGKIPMIGATTFAEYEIIVKDAALERRANPVTVLPPDAELTLDILIGVSPKLSEFYGVEVSREVLKYAVHSSNRFVTGRFQPDNALTVLSLSMRLLQMDQTNPREIELKQEQVDLLQNRVDLIAKDTSPASKRLLDLNQTKLDVAKKELGALRAQPKDMLAGLQKEAAEAEKAFNEANTTYGKMQSANDPGAGQYNANTVLPLFQRLEDLQGQVKILLSSGSVPALTGGKRMLTKDFVDLAIAQITTRPLHQLRMSEGEFLAWLEKELKETIFGQDDAIDALIDALYTNSAGIGAGSRPKGAFIYAGADKTGRTHTVQEIATKLMGDPGAIIEIDMLDLVGSENPLWKLLGTQAGYKGSESGGQLSTAVHKKRGQAVVHMRNFDRAPEEVQNLIKTILEKGVVPDTLGRLIDYRNTIFVLSTTEGSNLIAEAGNASQTELASKLKAHLRDLGIRSDLLSDIDDVVAFRPLKEDDLLRIAGNALENISRDLDTREILVHADDSAKRELVRQTRPSEGVALDLSTVIRKKIMNPLARLVVDKQVVDADITVGFKDGAFTFHIEQRR